MPYVTVTGVLVSTSFQVFALTAADMS